MAILVMDMKIWYQFLSTYNLRVQLGGGGGGGVQGHLWPTLYETIYILINGSDVEFSAR